MPDPADWIEIGKIVAPQGLTGGLRVYPSTDFPERFLDPGERWLRSPSGDPPRPVTLTSGRYLEGKGLFVIRLKGITHRDQADALRDHVLLVPESDRLPLDDDEFHVSDLIGLEVYDQQQQTWIGTVVDVTTTAHDLLVVERPGAAIADLEEDPPAPPHPDRRKSAKTRRKKRQPPVLIPFVMDIVPVVDLVGRRIEITPPPGLIEDSVEPSPTPPSTATD
jgi:16S rRNA processing protein RimM